jgi:hypothetical protein
LGTRTGRPSDAPIPLCLCKTPASTIPRSGSITGGNGSRPFVALAMDWFKCDWEDQEGRGLTKWSHSSRSAAIARSRFIATILLPFGSSLRLSNYRRRVEFAPRLQLRAGEARPGACSLSHRLRPTRSGARRKVAGLSGCEHWNFWLELCPPRNTAVENRREVARCLI